MKYARILMAVAAEPWAIQPEKMQAIVALLTLQAAGGKLTDDEITARITKQDERDVARAPGSIAVLPLRGVIANRMSWMDDISGGTSTEGFARAFQAALNDEAIKAIVLDVDSPGGAVAGTPELAQMIFDARGQKPIVAQVNATAASAAYWIATAADEVVVTPSGAVGSIGVLAVHDDISKALAEAGVTRTLISAGKFKVEGNPFEPLGDDARAARQQRIDAAYDTFVRDVARNRGTSLSAVRDGFGQGRMVDSTPAIEAGMADRIGTMQDTLNRFGASLYAPPKAKARAFAHAREKRALDFHN